jgi:hypothetical protein
MAKKNPPPASNTDWKRDWKREVIDLEPEDLLRALAKIPPADRKQLLAEWGLLEESQDEDHTQIGRPPEFPELEIMINFYLANKRALDLTDDSFKEMVKETYRCMEKRGPKPKTITKQLQAARREAVRRGK